MAGPPVDGVEGAGVTAEAGGWFAGAVGPVGRVEGLEGAAVPIGGAEEIEEGGVAEAMGSGAAGAGPAAVDDPMVDGFLEVGAPRPKRLGPLETLRCTGYAPVTGGATGETGAAAGVPGLLRLGPETGEFAVVVAVVVSLLEDGAAWWPGAPAAVVRLLGSAVDLWTTVAPVEPVVGWVAGRVTGLLLGPVVAAVEPVAAEAEVEAEVVVAAGEAAVLPEPALARWTLTTAPPERAAVPLELLEPVEARWAPVAASPGPVAVPREPPTVVPGVVFAGLCPVGAPAAAAAAVLLEPVAARWTLTAEPVGPLGVLLGVAACWARTGALPVSAAVGPGPVGVAARAGAAPGESAATRWTLTVVSRGLAGVEAGPAVVGVAAVGVVVGPAVDRWTTAAARLGAGAGPVEPEALAAGLATGPLGRAEGLLPLLP